MKKSFKQILCAMLVTVMFIGVMPITGFATSEKTFGYLNYAIADGEVAITGCDETAAGKIEIPASIDGYPVTKIHPGAFSFRENITEFYIPESINLISNTSFEGCSGVEKFVVDSKNTVYDSRENCNAIIETKTNILIRGCRSTVIPKSVTAIGSFAFNNVTSLKNICISDKITSIGKSAFRGCTSLEEIRIPDSVTTIGDGAFYACSKLSFVKIGNGLKSIGYTTFAYCSELNNLTIGSSVERIEASAFKGCSSLDSVEFPNSVTSIGDESFAFCSKLTDVIFGYGIEKMGLGTFNDTDLKYVFYDGSEASWNEVEMYDNTKETFSNVKIHYNTKDHAWGEWVTVTEATNEAKGLKKSTCSVCGYEKTKAIPRIANTFSISLISESETEAVISLNLDEGEFNAFDAQILFPSSLSMVSYGSSENWINQASTFGYCLYNVNKANGKVSAVSVYDYISKGSVFLFTLRKSESTPIDFSKFDLILTSCTMNDNEEVTPIAIVKVCEHKTTHVKTAAECTKRGEEYDLCSLCGAKLNLKTTTGGHVWGEWLSTPATCYSDGKKERTCSLCGKSEIETIPGGHKWGDYNITEEPTKEADGKGERVCSVCGAKDEIGFKFKEDNSTGVQLMFPYESEDETVKVKDETKTIGNIIKDIKIRKIYNITMLKDGEPIQPKGSVEVRIPIPKGFDRNKVRVYHIVNNDTMECVELDKKIVGNDIEGYYVVFTTDHFSYFAIGEEVGKVNSVSVSDITLNYKGSTTLKPTIKAEANAEYTVKYSSSNTKVATVDKNGKVYAAKKGSATITCTVTDSLGNVVTDTCKVTVKYSFGQWLIKILLFGWIWY